MTTLLSQIEAAPSAYPSLGSPAPTFATVAWQRIESYIAHRYTSRGVTWVVEGPGEWHAPLSPAVVSTVEVWSRGADVFETATLDASPLGGYWLPCTGPYRFTGTVGGGSPAPTVPEAVTEAVKRLAAYLASKPGTPGATQELLRAGSIETRVFRSASWMASALQNSGAADLLRQFRKV